MKLSSASSNVLRELSSTVKSMTKSPKLNFLVIEVNFALQELQKASTTFPQQLARSSAPHSTEASNISSGEQIRKPKETPIMQVMPLATIVTLLIEIGARTERIVDTVIELASLAEFKQASDRKPGRVQPENELTSISVVQKV